MTIPVLKPSKLVKVMIVLSIVAGLVIEVLSSFEIAFSHKKLQHM